MVLGVPFFATIIELTNEFLNKRLEKKGLSTEFEDNTTDDTKKPKLRREAVSLSDGFGPLTKQEKECLLSLSLARKYDLYAKQNSSVLAACVGEYMAATAEADVQAPVVQAVQDETSFESAPAPEAAVTSEESHE